MKKISLFILFTVITAFVIAQPQFGTHFLSNTLQQSQTNPAFLPEEGVIISLPNIYSNLELQGPALEDILGENAAGETVIDVDKAISNFEETNSIREHLNLETLGITFGLGPVRLSVQHAVKFGTFLKYPKTIPQLVWQGNAQFVGQDISLNNDLQISAYNELSVAGAIQLDRFTIGARAKYLTGIGDISTSKNEASLYTDDDIYQMTFNADYEINTSSFLEYNGIDDFSTNINFGQFSISDLFTKNSGFGLDVGVVADLGKLQIAGSVLDVGNITWTENISNQVSNGSFEYQGIDISNAITSDSISLSDGLDSLRTIFEPVENTKSYSTAISPKLYLSGSYDISSALTIGGLFYAETFRENTKSAFSLAANAKFYKWLNAGVTYSVYNNTYANIGLNAMVRLGLVQVLAGTDNILAVVDPKSSRFSNFRLGANLIF